MTPLSMAFDPRLTAEALVESGQRVLTDPRVADYPDDAMAEAERLMYFGITLAEIDALPTTNDVFPGADDSDN